MNKVLSYTSANSLPVKLFKNEEFLNGIKKKKILPIHLQISLTNKCNLNCYFCSCKNEDRNLEFSFEQIKNIIEDFKNSGMQSVTITGGGEPLLHPKINQIINLFFENQIKIGLVTNGTLLNKLEDKTINKITWCRISCTDERKFDEKLLEKTKINMTDWAFSYVIGINPDILNLKKYIEFTNKNNFTHIRVVSDLINLDSVPSLIEIKNNLGDIDDKKVIYQSRQDYSRGQEKCLISLLKPMLSADGKIYPCCGVQYAKKTQSLSFSKEMRMGTINDIKKIWENQEYFNGSNCYRCYYENYNKILSSMISEINHIEFV